MSSVVGTWALRMRTPIGSIRAEITIRDEGDGLAGQAVGAAETVPLRDVQLDGSRLTWSQSITKPMRLHLDFDVEVDGDELAGFSKAGRLPRSSVTGKRLS